MLDQPIEKLDNSTQTIEVEQMLGGRGGRTLDGWRVIGAAQGDGGVAPVGEHDNQVGIVPSAQANDLDAMTAEGMMRMGDGDESRRRLG